MEVGTGTVGPLKDTHAEEEPDARSAIGTPEKWQ
jgi:hypothetical protein